MRAIRFLALGLLSIGTAVASRCKPSTPSSSSSTPSSASSSTSSAAAASSSAASCGPFVENSDFSDGLAGWTETQTAGTQVSLTTTSDPAYCSPYDSCAYVTMGADGGSIGLSQPLTGLVPGAQYTFGHAVRVQDPRATVELLNCSILDSATLRTGPVWPLSINTVAYKVWFRPSYFFTAPAADVLLSCVFYTRGTSEAMAADWANPQVAKSQCS